MLIVEKKPRIFSVGPIKWQTSKCVCFIFLDPLNTHKNQLYYPKGLLMFLCFKVKFLCKNVHYLWSILYSFWFQIIIGTTYNRHSLVTIAAKDTNGVNHWVSTNVWSAESSHVLHVIFVEENSSTNTIWRSIIDQSISTTAVKNFILTQSIIILTEEKQCTNNTECWFNNTL